MKRLLVAGTAVVLLAAGVAAGKDVYKAFLSPEVPHHRAIQEILAQIEANPLDASLYNDLGCLVAWDGFWRDALRNFETASKLDKGDTRPMFNAGIVYAYMGEWGNAKSAFKGAVKRGPGNWAGWWMLGFAEEQLGNLSAAVDAYKTSLRMDTSLFDVKRNPFAANTHLKAVVLTATYDKRLARAAMPRAEEFANEARIGALLQPSKAVPRAASPSASEPETSITSTGPVITTVPPPSSAPPRPGAGTSVPPSRYRQVPPRSVTPAPVAIPGEQPPAGDAHRMPGPGGSEPAPAPPETSPGVPQTAPGPPQTAPGAPPAPTAVIPGPGGGA